jgi:hypothetical protein
MIARDGHSDSSGKPERPSAATKVTAISSAGVRRLHEEDMSSGLAANQTARSNPHEGPRGDARFRIFVIDTGQHPIASKVLRENFALLQDINRDDPAYYLDHDKSADLLNKHPRLIGRDPIIMVQDVHPARQRSAESVRGFRVHLGLARNEEDILTALRMLARFLRSHSAAKNLQIETRDKLVAEGFPAAIEIVNGNG